MSRVKLIAQWQQAWRLYSVQFAAALMLAPEAIYQLVMALGQVLPALPAVVLEYLPPQLRVTLAVIGAVSITLRLIQQIKLKPTKEPDA